MYIYLYIYIYIYIYMALGDLDVDVEEAVVLGEEALVLALRLPQHVPPHLPKSTDSKLTRLPKLTHFS